MHIDRFKALRAGFIAATVFAGTSGVTFGSDWNQFRGPLGNGTVSTEDGAVARGFEVRWKRTIGSGYSGIAVAGDLLVTAMAEGGSDWLVGLSVEDGARRWAVRLGPAHKGQGGSLDGAISSPTIAAGAVYAFGPKGDFLAVGLENGEELWRLDLSAEKTEAPYYGFSSSPVVHGNLVIVQLGGEAGAVIGIERDTGRIAWRSFPGPVYAQSPKIVQVRGRSQLVVATSDSVAGLDPEEGTLLWRWPYQGNSAFVQSTSPLPVGDGRLFFTPGDHRAVVLEVPNVAENSAASEPPQPTVTWEADVLTRTYSPALVLGDQLIGYTSRFLGGYDAATGARRWRSRAPGDGFLIAVNGQLVVLTKAGSLHLANVSADGYREVLGSELFEEIVWTPPSYSDNSVFVRSMTEIARVDLVTDAQRQLTDATGRVEDSSLPAIAAVLELPEAERSAAVDRLMAELETPLIEGNRVAFLWQGEAADVGISGDFLGMRREAPLQRIGGTDLWWFETEVDPRLQYTYFLYVDYEAKLDPLNPQRAKNSVMGYNANWTRQLVDVSYFAMPEWTRPPAHLREGAPRPEVSGTWTSVELTQPEDLPDPRLARLFEAPLTVWLPPGYQDGGRSYPTAYWFAWPGLRDADGGNLEAILNATVSKSFEPTIMVMVDRRWPPQLPFRLIVDAVDGALRTRNVPEQRAVIGHGFFSFDGLLQFGEEPNLFRKFGVQTFFGFVDMVEEAATVLEAVQGQGKELTGYLEWGTLDTRSPSEGWDMRRSSRNLYQRLEKAGVAMSGGEVVATTDWKSWRNRLHVMLGTLFPVE